jgi:hypothetical protein
LSYWCKDSPLRNIEKNRGAKYDVKSGKETHHMPITPQDFVSKWKRAISAFAVYDGRKSDLGGEEILERLLALNLERAKEMEE